MIRYQLPQLVGTIFCAFGVWPEARIHTMRIEEAAKLDSYQWTSTDMVRP